MNKYSLILADPPWNYNNAGYRGAAHNEYPTMKLDELKRLPIKSLANDDCVMLMWATWPKLDEDCLPLLKAWGFKYITAFPWIKVTDVSKTLWGKWEIKVPYGVGFWARGCSELLLIGRRGKPKPPPDGFIGLLSPNLFHSRKPDDVYSYAESMPGPYLELFARKKHSDLWSVWGNEVDGVEMPWDEKK